MGGVMGSYRCTGYMWRGLSVVIAIAAGACGGSSERTLTGPTVITPPAISPTPPAPTPTQTTFTLDASSDHFNYSTPLAGLQVGEALDVAVRPLAVNRADGEQFGHTVGVWVFSVRDPLTADFATDGTALLLSWTEAGWNITSRTPQDRFQSTGRRVHVPIGDTRRFRVLRASENAVQFGFEGETMITVSQVLKTAFVFAQVVGARAEFSYVPQPDVLSTDARSLWRGSGVCGLCAAAR
jgi:hypothetical protein